MRRLIRIIRVAYWVSVFFINGIVLKLIFRNPLRLRHHLSRNTSRISRKLLCAFNIKLTVHHRENLSALKTGNHLIVSNHLSYTDIVLLSSLHPFVFITSTDMAQTPFLGEITRIGGSLFTDRKKHTNLPQEINNFADALREGFDVVLFPEGTSTNGAKVSNFRTSLFQISILAKKPILPICIRYTTIEGQPISSQQQRDKICWYDEMLFHIHIWELLKHDFTAEVTILPAIAYDEQKSRQQLSEEIFSRISHCYRSE